jgi:hypothetical protein
MAGTDGLCNRRAHGQLKRGDHTERLCDKLIRGPGHDSTAVLRDE